MTVVERDLSNSTRRSISPPGPEVASELARDPETSRVGFEAVRLLAAGVAVIFVGYLVYNSTRHGAPSVTEIMLLDAGAACIAGFVFWLANTQRVRITRFEVLGAVLALTVSLNVAVSVLLSGEASDLQFMMAVAMGGAASVISIRWLLVVLIGPTLLGTFSATMACPPAEIVHFVVSQTGASVVAIVIFVGRVRGQYRVLEFRKRDARTNQELIKALDRAEREFQEHQATEQRRLELLEQLRQAQKLEALGTLAGGIAHDINNVIGAITAIASATVNELPKGAPGRRELQQVLVAARRSTTLTRNLVRFARQDQPRNAPFSPDEEAVREVEALLQRTLAKHIELKVSCGCEHWVVLGDAGLIGHVLMNLCLNSAEAIAEHGIISIRTRPVSLKGDECQQLGVRPGDYVEISVLDNGQGMSSEVLRRAFEPFFSTKDAQRRSGLGLPMAYGTIQQHGGGLRVESEPGRGTCVRVVLPAVRRTQVPAEHEPPRSVRVSSVRPVALFVDDEPLLRKAGKRMLVSLGYEVMLATNGQEALEQYTEHRYRIGVVVLDVAMPVMSGAECCRELKRLDPGLPVLLASGFPKGADLQSLLSLANVRYLQKPYELDDLVANLAELEGVYRDSMRIACQVNLVRSSTSAPP